LAAIEFQACDVSPDQETDEGPRIRDLRRNIKGGKLRFRHVPRARVEAQCEARVGAGVVLPPHHAGLHVLDPARLRETEPLGELHPEAGLAGAGVLEAQEQVELVIVVLVDRGGSLRQAEDVALGCCILGAPRRDPDRADALGQFETLRPDRRLGLGKQEIAARLGSTRCGEGQNSSERQRAGCECTGQHRESSFAP